MEPWIQTHSGVKFDFSAPTAEMIRLRDIAHALARICRFGGHVQTTYSVADHSCNVAQLLLAQERRGQALRPTPITGNRATLQWGLLHDAAEAYIGDLVAPLKAMLPEAIALEKRIQACVQERFHVRASEIDFEAVKLADEALLVAEAEELFGFAPLEDWTDRFHADDGACVHEAGTADQAEARFLCVAYFLLEATA